MLITFDIFLLPFSYLKANSSFLTSFEVLIPGLSFTRVMFLRDFGFEIMVPAGKGTLEAESDYISVALFTSNDDKPCAI